MITGSSYQGHNLCSFVVWAPFADDLSVKVVAPDERTIAMKKDAKGYWRTTVNELSPGSLYLYRINGTIDRPDPASHFQPQGVHGPSAVVDHGSFIWNDINWKGLALDDYIIYEIHTGVFTPEGTFEAVAKRLEYLRDLGITALELMPVAQFPGSRNWGYDGVYPYAPQNSYGGPMALKTLVNACHKYGIAVILDVVYNHLGPEGNYLNDFGPYFTDRYKTPWGAALNFDGPHSDEVRGFFIENALYWVTDFCIDALRIDAIHGIFDFSAVHFLRELGEKVRDRATGLGREVYVIAESDLNDVRVINPAEIGGYGLDAQWNDDFHHALHTLLTGENAGYYQDFGTIGQMVQAYREGFVYNGQYSRYRTRKHGNSSVMRPSQQFVVFSQNHDQVGNRLRGDRPDLTQSLEKLKLAACAVILSPFVPLLFMGEEYGETAPFQYFVDHSDVALIEAVHRGRRAEFAEFYQYETLPDPQEESTFLVSRINIDQRLRGHSRTLFRFYQHLIVTRKRLSGLYKLSRDVMDICWSEQNRYMTIRTPGPEDEIFLMMNFNSLRARIRALLPDGTWTKRLDSSARTWGGPGDTAPTRAESCGEEVLFVVRPYGVLLYEKEAIMPAQGI